MRRRFLHPKAPKVRRPPVVPYNPMHKAVCPWCNSLATLYVPAIAEGHCDDCGRSWRFLADPDADPTRPPTIKPKMIDYRDLVGFCVTMRRLRVTFTEARTRFHTLNIAEPAEDTWERAWKESEGFA